MPTTEAATGHGGTQKILLLGRLISQLCSVAADDERVWSFPGQDTNFHSPKAFSRHLILHQSKCQILEMEIGGNFASKKGEGWAC